MAKGVEHFFIHLLAICTSSFEKKSLFNSVVHLLDYFFCCLVFKDIYILYGNPLSDEYLAKIFSYPLGCLFTMLIVSFAVQKLLILMQLFLSILPLIS
jgi:hypothetical protein